MINEGKSTVSFKEVSPIKSFKGVFITIRKKLKT